MGTLEFVDVRGGHTAQKRRDHLDYLHGVETFRNTIPGVSTYALRADRVKTDARDALHLARLRRLDEVVAARVPSEVEESARDLVRCREAARRI